MRLRKATPFVCGWLTWSPAPVGLQCSWDYSLGRADENCGAARENQSHQHGADHREFFTDRGLRLLPSRRSTPRVVVSSGFDHWRGAVRARGAANSTLREARLAKRCLISRVT